jgi:hypothetical protein
MSGTTRTIVVGDVHGCADELDELLDRLAFSEGDRLVLVGDLVIRGPAPRRVLEIVRRAGGRSVRGNHEDRLLQYRALQAGRKVDLTEADRRILEGQWLRAVAAELDEADWQLIETLPLWLDLTDHDLRIVHAGVLPDRPIEENPERALLYLRNLRDDGSPSERRDDGRPWGASYQGPPHVAFGHNALPEPQLHPWATGLDTGCVYGGRLTALVLPAGEPVPDDPDARRGALFSVAAREAYVSL